ncbi:MAG: aspartate carbamoyltransferase regulatory subunit [Clostridium sp.]
MVTINPIKKGLVIDHIKAGCGMKIFNYLGLDKADFTVALIMNAESGKKGKKDIIKIENVIDLDFTILGLMDPNLTVNVIENETIKEKINLKLPERVENIVKCKNPRCVTSIEREISHVFTLVNEDKAEYKCIYCDDIYAISEV